MHKVAIFLVGSTIPFLISLGIWVDFFVAEKVSWHTIMEKKIGSVHSLSPQFNYGSHKKYLVSCNIKWSFQTEKKLQRIPYTVLAPFPEWGLYWLIGDIYHTILFFRLWICHFGHKFLTWFFLCLRNVHLFYINLTFKCF